MIVIKGMEMPKKCAQCLFNAYYENLGGYICGCISKMTDKDERREKRLDDCPLIEIVTCKDCKYNYENTCDFDGFGINDEYFCANAERKYDKRNNS